jgi:hypothetical protein
MKGKRWFLVGFLILAVSIIVTSCILWPERKTSTPTPDPRRTYSMEYDYMVSYDVFTITGQQRAEAAFSAANTDLAIHFSDVIIPAEMWPYDSLGYYYDDYWDTVFIPGTGTRLRYKSYLIGIQDAWGKPPQPGGGVLIGETRGGRMEGVAHSIIFVQAIRDAYGGDQNMESKTTIHEMGHIRAIDSHLCDTTNIYIMNPDHNDSSCVMGQGKIATCTGQDLSINPHFCPICIDKVKKVSW